MGVFRDQRGSQCTDAEGAVGEQKALSAGEDLLGHCKDVAFRSEQEERP